MDYQKYNYYRDGYFWDDRNLSGLANIIRHSGKIYSGNLELLAETRFKYACIDKQIARSDYSNIEDYMRAYEKFPFIEMLQKLCMTKMVDYVVEHYYGTELFDMCAEGGPAIFQITKERFNRMRENNMGVDELRLFQMEKRKGIRLTDQEVDAYTSLGLTISQMEIIIQYTTDRY